MVFYRFLSYKFDEFIVKKSDFDFFDYCWLIASYNFLQK